MDTGIKITEAYESFEAKKPNTKKRMIFSETPYKNSFRVQQNFFEKLVSKCRAFFGCPRKPKKNVEWIIWESESSVEKESVIFNDDDIDESCFSSMIGNRSNNVLFTRDSKRSLSVTEPFEQFLSYSNQHNQKKNPKISKFLELKINIEKILTEEDSFNYSPIKSEASHFKKKSNFAKGLEKIIEEITCDQEETMDHNQNHFKNQRTQNLSKIEKNIETPKKSYKKSSLNLKLENLNQENKFFMKNERENENVSNKISNSPSKSGNSHKMSILNENAFIISKTKSDSFVGKAAKNLPIEFQENNPFLMLNQEKFVYSEYEKSNREMDIETESRELRENKNFQKDFFDCKNFIFQERSQNPFFDLPFMAELSPIHPLPKSPLENKSKTQNKKGKLRLK